MCVIESAMLRYEFFDSSCVVIPFFSGLSVCFFFPFSKTIGQNKFGVFVQQQQFVSTRIMSIIRLLNLIVVVAVAVAVETCWHIENSKL